MNLKRVLEFCNFTCFTNNYVKFWKFIIWIHTWKCWKHRLEFLGIGRERAVYRRGNHVIKVPVSVDGFASNDKESRVYRDTTDGWLFGIRYARCKLHWSGLLVMEYVEPVHSKNMPSWTNYIDCQQVGYNKKDQLVAYDYGY